MISYGEISTHHYFTSRSAYKCRHRSNSGSCPTYHPLDCIFTSSRYCERLTIPNVVSISFFIPSYIGRSCCNYFPTITVTRYINRFFLSNNSLNRTRPCKDFICVNRTRDRITRYYFISEIRWTHGWIDCISVPYVIWSNSNTCTFGSINNWTKLNTFLICFNSCWNFSDYTCILRTRCSYVLIMSDWCGESHL